MIEGITIIIPTIGRPSLADTVGSVVEQLSDRDRVVVLHNGEHSEESAKMVLQFSDKRIGFLAVETQLGDYGHPARNRVLDRHVHTSHVWSLDDDDIARPGALGAMREHFDDPWTLFRMHFGPGHYASGITLPHSQRIAHGNLGTPMIFAPLTPARFGHHYSGDFDYAYELEQLLGPPVYAADIVATVRP